MSEERKRDAGAYAPTAGPLGGPTLPHDSAAAPDGTLDLPAGDQVASGPELAPGHKIGHFVIRARIGEGGMGVVVAGRDPDLGRDVAIKLVRSEVDHPAYRARLLREAQAMGRLEHPNVVRVYEVGSDRGRLFVVMELVDGVTLSTWLKVQRRSWREVIAMFEQIGAGLAAVHRAGLVHRDFKPDNVLVDRDGRARVADFGLARLDPDRANATAPSPELAVQLTRTGVMMGTPGYMAPEQQYGGNVDARADQYSYCIALREALVGGRGRPKDLDDAKWRDVPGSVRAIVARGLSYDPSDRFASMEELLSVLGRAGTRRRAVIGGVIAGLAIAGSITAAVAVTRGDRTPQPTPQPVVTEVVADPRSVDAAVLVTTVTDAAVIALVPGDAAPQDARTVIAHRDPSPNPARAITPPAIVPAIPPPVAPPPVTAGSSASPPPQLTIITAWSGRTGLPAAANPKDPAHRAVLAATIRDLGLDGFDPKATTDGIDPTDVLETAIAHIKIGMIERRRGHCDKAIALWTDAKAALHPDLEPVWAARASMGIALCTLAAGKPADAENAVHGVWLSGNQDETRLVMALTHYESGDLDTSFGLFLVANRLANPRVQDAIKIWVAGTGLTLP